MGPHESANLKTLFPYKLQSNVFKLVLNFPPKGPHKTMLGIYYDFFLESFQIHHSNYGSPKGT